MNPVVAKVGDILVINHGVMTFRIIENFTPENKAEYILVNLHDFKAELWSKELHFKRGDHIFTNEFVITDIIPNDHVEVVHRLSIRQKEATK